MGLIEYIILSLFASNVYLMEKINFDKIPASFWVYLWKKWKKVLYVWKANNLRNRISQYFRTWIWVWKEEMVSKADDIDFIIVSNEEEALLLENQLIKKHKPPYNSLLKWDTGYTYIRISEWNFPKIEFTRYKDKPWIYIWPKPWKKDLKNILYLLRQILKFRTCSDTKFKKWQLCSDYIMWLCKWRCNDKQVKSEEWKVNNFGRQNNSEYENIVKLIVDYFNWDSEPIKKLIVDKISYAIEKQNFEYAAKLRDILFKLDKFINSQIVEFDEDITGYFVKTREYNWIYFMVYMKVVRWKVIDIVKLKNDENTFLNTMKNDWLIKKVKKIWENFYFCE